MEFEIADETLSRRSSMNLRRISVNERRLSAQITGETIATGGTIDTMDTEEDDR